MSPSQQIAQAGPVSPNKQPIIYKYMITHSSKETSEAIGTAYSVSSSGVLSVYIMERLTASYKRWQSIETITETPDSPTTLDKKLNLLEMRITQLDRIVRRTDHSDDTPKQLSGTIAGLPVTLPIYTSEELEDGTTPEKEDTW